MLISGYKRRNIIGGYATGYLGLATLQSSFTLFEALWLFKPGFGRETVVVLFVVIWLLAFVSVMLGIFVSTFARNEGQVFPFIPLFILPSVFLTGLIVDIDKLPGWAAVIGKCLPLHYAVNIIKEVIKPEYSLADTAQDFAILIGYAFLLWVIASLTLRKS